MKKITLWLFALFTCWQISAQTGTVVVGVDDGTPNTTTGYPCPLQDYYKTGRAQYLYRASELSAAGLAAGPITEIGWVATNLATSTLEEGYTISMKSTATTALTTTYEAGASVVYGPTDFTPSATGNVMFTLATPFVWDGTSNVIIEICGGAATGSYTENVQCSNSTLAYNGSTYFRSDTATTPCTTATGTASTSRPLLVAVGNVASCLAPLNLVSANVTAYAADVSWDASTSGSAVGYEYVVSTSSVAPAGAGTATTNLYASVGSLSPQTAYYLFVRTNCGGGTFSGWNGPISFTTACAPITTFPSLEPFASFLPNQCWMRGDNGDLAAGPATFGANGFYQDGFANVGSTGSFAYNIWLAAANDWIISPQYTIPATGYELKFDAAAVNYGATTAVTNWESDDFVEVLVSTTGTTNWTPLFTYNDTNVPSNTGSLNVLDLDAYAGQTVRFAYRVVEGAADGPADLEFSIDNFEVRLSPTCPDQTGLVVSNVTAFTADTSWNDMAAGGALGYEYAITTSATPPASGTATTAIFYQATGLSPQTVYYLHVRSTCAAATFGNWATVSFTTGCAPITTLPHLEPFNTFLPNQCWMNGVNGDLAAGPAAFTASGWGADGLANNGTTGAIRNNIYTTGANDWVISPQFTIPATGYELKFDAAAVQFAATTAPTSPWESDDFIEVLVSSTGTTNWTPIFTYNDTNQPGITATPNAIDLDAYAGQTVRFAFRAVEGATNGPADIDFSIDNFEVRLSPTCPDQTGLIVSNVTAFTADTSWNDMAAGGALGYEYAITTSATPPASGTATTAIFYQATGLSAQTVYYLHVRSTCAAATFGNWATTTFTTACAPIAALPWIENFDSVTTPAFPPCWSEQNGDYVTAVAGTYNTPHSGANYLRDAWSATNEFMWTPGFDLVAGTSYDFSSWIQGDGDTSWTVDFFVNNAQNSTGATQLGAQYAVPGTGTIAIQPYAQVTRSFVPATSGTYYFAFRVNEPTGGPWYVAFDDVELKLSPACPTPSASASGVTDVAATLNWTAVPSATLGYEYVLDNVATDPAGSGTSTMATTYGASGLTPLTTYYFHIRSVCSAGTYSTWSTVSFTTLATPPANDNLCNATALTVGTATGITQTLVAATGQTSEPTGACFSGGINGSVWYSFVAPTSGSVEVSTDFAGGTLEDNDTEIAVYAAAGVTCSDLTTLGAAIDCDQDSGNTNTTYGSFLSLTGLTSGNTYYVQVDRYNGVIPGTFGIQVTEVLSSSSFDTSNFVAYPNPVKDVLNLSYKTAISNVRVVNLLGQEVLNTKTNGNDVQVNMSSLTAGAYIVNITVEDTVHTIKVIKE